MFPHIFRAWFHFPPHLFGQNLNSMIISFTQSTESRGAILIPDASPLKDFSSFLLIQRESTSKFNFLKFDLFKVNSNKIIFSQMHLLLTTSLDTKWAPTKEGFNFGQKFFSIAVHVAMWAVSNVSINNIFSFFIKHLRFDLIRYQKSGVPPGPNF